MSKLWKLIIISLPIWSCNNDIKIAAPWKETIVIYGLLDPAASINYIRIQKAYLDPEGNAFQFVDQSDSIYPKELSVKLYIKKNGTVLDTIFPQLVNGDDIGIKKDTGLFSNTPNYLYKIDKKIFDSRLITGGSDDYEYELKVKNIKTGYSCSAKTNTTGLLISSAPVDESSTSITINDKPTSFLSVVYSEGRNVKTYDLNIRFWYEEIQKSDTSIKSLKYINWEIFKNRPTKSLRGYETQFFQIPGSYFYEILKASVVPNGKIIRKAKYCDVEYFGAGEDLYTFIQVNKPSIGIVQKRPEYTNVSNGLGIFSSRYITSFKNMPLSAEMKNTIKNSVYTQGLNFQ